MDREINSVLCDRGIEEKVVSLFETAEKRITGCMGEIEKTAETNQYKVILAMQKNRLSDTHFSTTTGYGYGDAGRDRIDSIFADIFKAEKAIVRHNIVAGTHAIAIALFGNLLPGDRLVSITGRPYDTLEKIIGTRGKTRGSLAELGVEYAQVDLCDGRIDFERIRDSITPNTKMVLLQRSSGYSWRRAINIFDIEKAVNYIKSINREIIVLVDNCYGEFVEEKEPVEAGADIVAGSLIKNPGGGIAEAGGYVAGRKEFVENAANSLTAPGLGAEVGPSLGHNRLILQGLFMSPHVVSESLKGAVLCSCVMELLGFETKPKTGEKRSDIIQAVKLGSKNGLLAFCHGIQNGSPVDSFLTPEPWDMPGYECPVIMAAGGFIQGSSIELSADGPVIPPYIAYLQGGLIYEAVKLGLMNAVQRLADNGIVSLDRKARMEPDVDSK